MKRIRYILLVTVFMLFLAGCGEEKKMKEDGITITLTNQFEKSTFPAGSWSYESPDAVVSGTYESKDELERVGLEIHSAKDYAATLAEEKGIKSSNAIQEGKGYLYFDSESKISGTKYGYRTCIYEVDDGYWLISFACYKEAFDSKKSEFRKWAESVVIE